MTAHASHTHLFVRSASYYDERAHGLLAVLRDGAPPVMEQVRTWHPELAGASDETVRTATFTIDDARLVYARQHGFESWPDLLGHLARLRDDDKAEPFLAVFEAGQRGDWPLVTSLLRQHPELPRQRGTNGNTLLNLACSMTPCEVPGSDAEKDALATMPNRLAAIQLLLSLGADVNQANDRGWTPLHQGAYRNDPRMCEVLLDAGARTGGSAHGEGGTPLAVALFWGHREAAELLAGRAVQPDNLRVAAGLGRTDLVAQCFAADGEMRAAAYAGRGFYRPHSGFPAWRASHDRQEVLDEALVWAAKSDRTEVMPLLVELGARVDADPYRGTPLLWAAANGRTDAVNWLLDHGADANQRATFGGPHHGRDVTALHLAAQSDRETTVALLLSRGADPTIADGLYGSTPAGWARHDGAMRATAVLSAWIAQHPPVA